jgi:hypothetical protein
VLRTMMLSQEELELTTNYLASRVGKGAARVVLQDGTGGQVRATFVLPANPLWGATSMSMQRSHGWQRPLAELRTTCGYRPVLRVPAFLCNWLLRSGMGRLEGSADTALRPM